MSLSSIAAHAARSVLNRVRATRTFELEQIRFLNSIDIWYARIPDPGQPNVAWLEPRPAGDTFRHHLTPPEVRPSVGNPHWARGGHANSPLSWPVAFQRGPMAAAAGPRQIEFRIRCVSPANYNGRREIKADSAGGLQTDAQVVQFNNGVATGVLTLTSVPGAVQRLPREVLRWQMRRLGEGWRQFAQSEHTFFFVLAAPRAPLGLERHYFEMFDWSCRWALGQSAPATVIQQIWQRFTTVGQPHDTRLIYWRNFQHNIPPAQDLAAGIRSYDTVGMGQYAISCIVFDRMFCNALALHGIRSAEMKLEAQPMLPNADPFIAHYSADATFAGHVDALASPGAYWTAHPGATWEQYLYHMATHGTPALRTGLPAVYKFSAPGGMEYFKPTGWRIANPAGHGTAAGPNVWGSHWIADVDSGGAWILYDPSYGVTQPWQDVSAVNQLVPPALYEHGSVSFDVVSRMTGGWVAVPTGNPNDPRLNATRLYIN